MADSTRVVRVRAVFGLIALGIGVYGGWLAHERTGSVWLAVFVGLIALGYIARGIADVITDPEKGKRFAYFTLPVVVSVGGLAGVYALTERWWVAVIVGFVLYGVGSGVANAVFPRIAAEEEQDSLSRAGLELEPQAYPDEDVNPLPTISSVSPPDDASKEF